MSGFRSRSVNIDHFSMIPRADIPRSKFKMETTHKTTFDAGYLVPIFVDEVLPGDVFNLKMTAFARMATPIFPIMDNAYMDTFFFFVPNRLVWDNWQKFMGEQTDPGDTIDYTIPSVNLVAKPAIGSIYDYMGIPQYTGSEPLLINALPFRAYNLIYNEWFRDENLQDSITVNRGDSSDLASTYTLKRRGKRHDYFTSALPFVQKGVAPAISIGGTADVVSNGLTPTMSQAASNVVNRAINVNNNASPTNPLGFAAPQISTTGPVTWGNETGLEVNLSSATSITVNALRQSFQIQKLLERDARGGTRYTEILRSHFGVLSPDARLQRPEYLGGGSTIVNINPIAQTSGTGTYADTPLGSLSATGTAVAHGHGFTQAFTEHGYIIGLASVRADLTYQQGLRKLWSRKTRYDYYFPVFAHLGEQAILNKEIYLRSLAAQDDQVFGYQERWAEYRYHPSRISGLFNSSAAQPLDAWHLAQEFTALPTLNSTFIEENPPFERVLAVGAAAAGQQFIFDSIFSITATRPMPMYSVPGLVDHF